eukprot:gene2438-3170_t
MDCAALEGTLPPMFFHDVWSPWMLDMVDPALVAAVQNGTARALRDLLTTISVDTRIYSLQVLRGSICRQLVEEIDHAQRAGLPLTRPNSMNNYGLILHEIGLAEPIERLMRDYVAPLARVFYPEWGGGALDDLHAFTIQYSLGEDRELSEHMDESEVTLNLCLGTNFTGAELFFRGIRDHPSSMKPHPENITVTHAPGVAVLHLGQHFHGAYPILGGSRYNLIAWCKSSGFRSSATEMFLKHCSDDQFPHGGTAATHGLNDKFTTELR